jgi:hypothetical protein
MKRDNFRQQSAFLCFFYGSRDSQPIISLQAYNID